MVVATTPGQAAPGAVAGLDNALRAIGALQSPAPDALRLRDMAAARRGAHHPLVLDEHAAKSVLARYDVAVPQGAVATTVDEARDVARSIDYPVVIKVVADGLIHKSDVGGVVVGVTSEDEVLRECARLLALAPHARVLIEQMAPSGIEVLVAARRDGVVPTLNIGLGGVWAEALADVACVPLPASPDRVRRALETLRGYALLCGSRGGEPVAIDALCQAASRIGDAMLTEGLDLIEVNPLIVSASGCVAVDAVVT
jgi:acyl-CoA synthetase (NDP forming)